MERAKIVVILPDGKTSTYFSCYVPKIGETVNITFQPYKVRHVMHLISDNGFLEYIQILVE